MSIDQSLPESVRTGSRLEHGEAHKKHHTRWSRRQFLQALGVASAGSSFMFQQTAMTAFGQSSMMNSLSQLETDRVLVLLQLDGGNDGLNTIVPTSNDIYYQSRPNLAIAKENTMALNDERGLNMALSDLYPLIQEGRTAIIEGVGYPSPNLSHFRSTDIWMSASDGDTFISTGWTGRSLEQMVPEFGDPPSPFPLGVQLGGSSFLFEGLSKNTGMSISSPEAFERLAGRGIAFEYTGIPENTHGTEMRYARQVINDSYRYATAIQDAAGASINEVTYPDTSLAGDLSIVARLIKGNLGARVYVVSIAGFDTHAEQEPLHTQLLQEIGGAVSAFVADMEAAEIMDRVLIMSFSEFGRSVFENGSFGTDHSTAAPLFVIGNDIQGGFHGSMPDLVNTDEYGDPFFTVDFRAAYEAVLQGWFGLQPEVTQSVLSTSFGSLQLFNSMPTSTEEQPVRDSFRLAQNYPNPAAGLTNIGYQLPGATRVRLDVYDIQGRHVYAMVDAFQAAGQYETPLSTQSLPAGRYFYKLSTEYGQLSRAMTVVR